MGKGPSIWITSIAMDNIWRFKSAICNISGDATTGTFTCASTVCTLRGFLYFQHLTIRESPIKRPVYCKVCRYIFPPLSPALPLKRKFARAGYRNTPECQTAIHYISPPPTPDRLCVRKCYRIIARALCVRRRWKIVTACNFNSNSINVTRFFIKINLLGSANLTWNGRTVRNRSRYDNRGPRSIEVIFDDITTDPPVRRNRREPNKIPNITRNCYSREFRISMSMILLGISRGISRRKVLGGGGREGGGEKKMISLPRRKTRQCGSSAGCTLEASSSRKFAP